MQKVLEKESNILIQYKTVFREGFWSLSMETVNQNQVNQMKFQFPSIEFLFFVAKSISQVLPLQ